MYRKLYRTVDGRTRYYLLSCQPNLFGDFIVSRVYGSALNKKPTGEKVELFASEDEARSYYEAVLRKKVGRGYVDQKLRRHTMSYAVKQGKLVLPESRRKGAGMTEQREQEQKAAKVAENAPRAEAGLHEELAEIKKQQEATLQAISGMMSEMRGVLDEMKAKMDKAETKDAQIVSALESVERKMLTLSDFGDGMREMAGVMGENTADINNLTARKAQEVVDAVGNLVFVVENRTAQRIKKVHEEVEKAEQRMEYNIDKHF